jgi:hypothetical protein
MIAPQCVERHRMRFLHFAIVPALLPAILSPADAQSVVAFHGRVVDCRSAVRIENGNLRVGTDGATPVAATVTLGDQGVVVRSVDTDAHGRFTLLAPVSGGGALLIEAEHYGSQYLRFESGPDGSVTVTAFLMPMQTGDSALAARGAAMFSRLQQACATASTARLDPPTEDRYILH